jgi:hypothetical protein
MNACSQSLREQLDEALRAEAEALQQAARLAASRGNGRQCAEAIRRAEILRARRVNVQREVRESRAHDTPETGAGSH